MCKFEEKSLDCHDRPSFVTTLILLCRNIIALCRDKDWFSLLEIVENYAVTYFLCKTPTLLNVFFLFYPDGGVAKGILRKFQFL